MIDDQIDPVDDPAKRVGLNVNHGDPIEADNLLGRQDIHLNVEQVHHSLILGPRDALQRRQRGGLLRSTKDVPQRETAGHGVGIGIVMEDDDDPIGVGEEPLILLNLESGEGAAELGK